jgi:hypothetical protein
VGASRRPSRSQNSIDCTLTVNELHRTREKRDPGPSSTGSTANVTVVTGASNLQMERESGQHSNETGGANCLILTSEVEHVKADYVSRNERRDNQQSRHVDTGGRGGARENQTAQVSHAE